MIKITLPAMIQKFFNNEIVISREASSVKELLEQMIETNESLHNKIFDKQGNLNKFINIYLNDEDIRFLDNLETILKDGDNVVISPAISGG